MQALGDKTTARTGAIHLLGNLCAAFGASQTGTIAILAGVTLPVMVGGLGLGAEAGLWYFKQRQLQHAADTAAHGGGIRRRQGDSRSRIEPIAQDLAIAAGFEPGRGTLTVNIPPEGGAQAGNARAVEVVISETIPRYFSSLFLDEPVTVSARAVTVYTNPSTACVLALAPTASSALKATGSPTVNLIDCATASNSMAHDAFDMGGAAAYRTHCVHTVGYAQTTAGLVLTGCPAVDELAGVTPDPYADVAMPPVTGPCHNKNVGHPHKAVVVEASTYTSVTVASGLRSMRFCHGLHLQGQVHFEPGIYIIEGGDLHVNAGAHVTGEDVMFFFTDGAQSRLNGSAVLELAAPDTGLYSGILFFGDRDDSTADHRVNGASGTSFQGAVYFPSQNVTYSGSASASAGCTQIIGYTIDFVGNSDLELDCSGAGVRDIEVAGAVVVVE